MKRYWLISSILVVGCILLLQISCQEQGGRTTEPESTGAGPGTVVIVPEPEIGPAEAMPVPEGEKKGPRITFENVVHDFGTIGPGKRNTCEFKFTNTGDGLLNIMRIQTCCGVRAGSDKKEYMPGESGTVRVRYNVPRRAGAVKKYLVVFSNDNTRPKVTLTIKARIVPKVAYEPKKLKLLLKGEDVSCPEIRLTSVDGQPFAIKSFRATTSAITADYDSSLEATSHVIRPNINTKRLQKRLRGRVDIGLTHPGCSKVTIPFDVLPQFMLDPPSIILYNAEPEKPVRKVVWILHNYGQDFEVESASSEKGIIEVLGQKKIGNRYRFELRITPPADVSRKRFADVFYVKIKDGAKLKVNCSGFYSGSEQSH
jgi:hypothetical protein